ncbi:proline--tRNA ligase [Ureibacillus manganicus]|uniref:Proline--tRNA ligase n=1 Tax=Ureibacillus manganicus DSM 26584 TaxID=1384049 RepID=A0A0A3I6I6_9BACL|nr:proline--tRNA ligase [Ureibacillus manganicus]KGR80319.1 hypothetical protein CD29_00050 [Ureibacillus manganicus DSM 26584]
MKQSLAFIRTNHEMPSIKPLDPNERLIRAGYIHSQNDKFISLLPLGKRVLQKIEKIIREEMNVLTANEVSLPTLNSLQSLDSNERQAYSAELFQLNNRNKDELYLTPSHLEILSLIVKEKITSYKQLPFVLYQIQTKYRDELNINGMFKNREFLTLDVYSFHHTTENLEEFYEKIDQVYSAIFRRLGLPYKKVLADLGSYCGELSHEYVVLSENGEVTIAQSNQSDFAVNFDVAKVTLQTTIPHCEMKELIKEKISDTGVSADDFQTHIDIPADRIIKTNVYQLNGELIVVLYRGDHILNEVKLKNVLNVQSLKLADEKLVSELFGCTTKYVGPIKLPVHVKVIADFGIKSICNGISFGNEEGSYYVNVNPERDFAINEYADLRYIQEGEPSPDGNGIIQFAKGHEVAHIFKLGAAYSEQWNASFLDEQGVSKPILMGTYGFGVSRLFAVAAEMYQDEKGFIWPNSLAPFDVHLITECVDHEEGWLLSEQLYNILLTYQFEVLFDDRQLSIDVKYKDANLIGLPVQVIVGKKASEGIVTVVDRRTGQSYECAKEELIDRLNEFFRVY